MGRVYDDVLEIVGSAILELEFIQWPDEDYDDGDTDTEPLHFGH